jgi:hypothetical protein
MTKPSSRVSLIILALLQAGCLTIGVATKATDPHPSFSLLSTVSAAAIHNGELFLRLEALQGKLGNTHKASIIGIVELSELKRADTVPSDVKSCHVGALRKVPIRLQGDGIMPPDVKPVPVREVLVDDQAELEQLVFESSEQYAVLLVNGKPAGPLANLYNRCRLGQGDSGGSYVAVVFPSDEDRPVVSLMQDFSERPRTRWAWWLITPLSVAGDIITSPVQLICLLSSCMD